MEETPDPIGNLDAEFSHGLAGSVVCEEFDKICDEMNSLLMLTAKYLQYLSSMYHMDPLYVRVEAEILRYETELRGLQEKLFNSLGMALDIGRPAIINI